MFENIWGKYGLQTSVHLVLPPPSWPKMPFGQWNVVCSMNMGPNAKPCGNHRFLDNCATGEKLSRLQLSSNVQTACSTDSLNNCPKHSILRFSSFALKIYLWLKMCQHNLPCSIVYAHCLLLGRAFASLYVLLFLEKEAVIGGRDFESRFWCWFLLCLKFVTVWLDYLDFIRKCTYVYLILTLDMLDAFMYNTPPYFIKLTCRISFLYESI